jgi:putative FmdB family regulatory protein
MRSNQIKPTKHHDKVSEDHRCLMCGKGPDEVNFTVSEICGKFYVRSQCNVCKKHKVDKTMSKIKKEKTISKKITAYFKTQGETEMIYLYECEKCKKKFEINKPMNESSREEHCGHCDSVLKRIYTSSTIKTADGVKNANSRY